MKYIITLLLFNSLLFSNTNLLSTTFKSDVVELPIYKKIFRNYLSKKCNEDEECKKESIFNIKTWESTKENKKLQRLLKRKNSRINFDELYWIKLENKIFNLVKNKNIKKSQFISLIDLSKQLVTIVLYDQKENIIKYIGSDLVSTGDMLRERYVKKGEDHYFKTPTGVFEQNNGWRSDGKYSEVTKSYGYGQEGSFIFYFGKQQAKRLHTFNYKGEKLRNPDEWKIISDKLTFAMHSHQSSTGYGKPYSHGCVRTTHELNKFMDKNSILHKNSYQNNKWIVKYNIEPNNKAHIDIAGKYLVIVDNLI